ncbi:MAG: HD domain-containing protein [Phycisphaerales bacterium]|nr:MAG: HD domain-containing protein [Phycisphaerales bacterium]
MLKTTTRELTCLQRRELERFGERVSRFGVNFAVVDAQGQIAVLLNAGESESDTQELITAGRQVLEAAPSPTEDPQDSVVWQFADGQLLLAVPLCLPLVAAGHRAPVGTAIIDLGPAAKQVRSSETGPTADRSAYLAEMLKLLAQNFQTSVRTDEQMEMVGTELSLVYEELVLLHKISMNMRVTESDTNFLQLACDSLTEIVAVDGIAVLLERVVDGDRQFVVAAGSGLIDLNSRMAHVLHGRLVDELRRGQEALLDSDVDTPWRFEWPGHIRNIICVPLYAKGASDPAAAKAGSQTSFSIIGYMVAVNHAEKPDFDSTDIKLFTSVASGCAVFIENGRLFNDLKELFVGSLRALTNSIDAKDQYTRGHSERVAIISRWLGERIAEQEPFDEEEIHRLYLAGLLHDIGKIGVDESVLCKNGKLTDKERACIQRHPAIGAGILNGIKQMRDIVPGVLCHHERVDGKGYPKGLRGDEIPLSARIIGLADSFDAMTSKRVYRNAMTIEHALAEIRKGLGTQFDEKIGTIFLNSDIGKLWELIQGTSPSLYGREHLADYGTAAVGTLLR